MKNFSIYLNSTYLKILKHLKKFKQTAGFTLIELIIYIALLAIFISGAILFSWDLIFGREKTWAQQVVEQNARAAMARISYEIERAQDINNLSSTSLELENGVNDTIISLNGNTIQITSGGAGPYNLTSNQVKISDLTFTQIDNNEQNTKSINVSLAVERAQTNVEQQFTAQTILEKAVELLGQFNQARALLMNTENAVLSAGNKRLIGTTLENSGPINIIIDQIAVSWEGGQPSNILQDIVIGGITVWSGTANSGDNLDILDITLFTNNTAVFIDQFQFSQAMGNSTINILYTMSDNSTTQATLLFGEGPSPSPGASPSPSPSPISSPGPSPSPSPSPVINSCNDYCQASYSLPGVCIKQKDCSGINEGAIYECSPPNICCCQ